MAQQARNLCMFFQEQGERRPTHIIRDRDTKFTDQFCDILATEDIEFCRIPPRSPDLNPFAEAWVQRIKHECLNHFIVFGERHLRHLIREWVDYYHRFRPHQGLENVPISTSLAPPEPLEKFRLEEVVCHEQLCGLLRHYERQAA
jgi:putative transposase